MLHFLLVLSIFISLTGCLPTKPNIVFILVDDLGWNDVSWHNPEVIMPNLASLAEDGLILEQAYSQPTCSPSRAALLTGYYPSRTGYQFMPPNNLEPMGLPTSFTLLPEYLKNLGYSSHGLGKWHLGYCSPDYLPTNRGFDSYLGLWNGGGAHFFHTTAADMHDPVRSQGYDFHLDEKIHLEAFGKWTADIFVDRVRDILDNRAGMAIKYQDSVHMETYNTSNPFFLYLAYQDVKLPLEVDPKFETLYPDVEETERKTYLGMVSAVDDSVGRIVQQLKDHTYKTDEGEKRSLFQDTIFVFSSDNGGMSRGLGYGGADNWPLRGRKGDMWEGGCRVPSFISGVDVKGESDVLIHFTDWLPTIYGLAGGNINDLGDIDGVNQIGVLQGQQQPIRNEILYDIANFQNTNHTYFVSTPPWPADLDLSGSFGAGIRYGDFKLLVGCTTVIGCCHNYNSTWGGNTDKDRILLFNVVTDPEEDDDLSLQLPEVVEELKMRLDKHLSRAVKPGHSEIDPAGHPNNHFPPGQYFTGWCDSKAEP